ncbi:hypothetical protein D3C72_2114910 [compost metagenome]
MRHLSAWAVQRRGELAEEQRLQALLDDGEAVLKRFGVPVRSVLLPAKTDAIAELLDLEARMAPELIVLRQPSGDDARQLVARSRSSVLLLP